MDDTNLNVNKENEMSIYEKYLTAKKELDAAKKRLEETQVELYSKFSDSLDFDTGTFSHEDDGFSIKIIKKESIKVDQDLASVVGIGFKKEYKLDKKIYKKLSDEDKKRVDECLTTKPAKPTFLVERV